jgi:hypothetical protein
MQRTYSNPDTHGATECNQEHTRLTYNKTYFKPWLYYPLELLLESNNRRNRKEKEIIENNRNQ